MNKLYRVTLKGMIFMSIGIRFGCSYVVAKSSDEAYQKVKTYLDSQQIGFAKDRVLDKVELIADEQGDTNTLLFL
jgi:non-ribosomal peptide synthetase component E (peptide arylation enzyme)